MGLSRQLSLRNSSWNHSVENSVVNVERDDRQVSPIAGRLILGIFVSTVTIPLALLKIIFTHSF